MAGPHKHTSCCLPGCKDNFDCNARDDGQDNEEEDQDNENFQDHETYEKSSKHDYQEMSNFLEASRHQSHNSDRLNPRHTSNHNQRCSQSYYQLPTSSPSTSSVASSSGCSSSSSVVSSSSSSLSYDEDQEDLYGDADSTPSSSASTSSLLSSTTLSMMSATSSSASAGSVSAIKTPSQHNHHQQQKGLVSSKGSPLIGSVDSAVARQTTCCSTPNPPADVAQRNTSTNVGNVCPAGRAHLQNSKQAKLSSGHDKHLGKMGAGQAVKQPSGSLINCMSLCYFERGPAITPTSSSCAVISENFYPTVIGRSEYGNFKEAMYHLEKKLIATRSPEEIRGGGLLKYCNLLVKRYKPTNVYQIRTLERYMCSRFFIDFSDLNQQRAKLESYLANHFSDDPIQKFDYLTILHNVVQRSTVCLMNHELRLTLTMIRELAYKLNEQQQAQQQDLDQNQHQLVQQQISSFQHQPLEQAKEQYYQPQEPVVMQSGIYRVKLINYALTKPVKS